MGERLYGLDWLRVGAFALLILYHVGMFFVPWEWHIKSPRPLGWLALPMQALSPWRLSLLFLISGVASAFLLAKLGGAGKFARSRSTRLLIPLVSGMVLFVPPQPWVELTVQHGYSASFWRFWASDYFRFGQLHGIDLPTWNHLWFVAYLWAYTMVLGLCAAVLPAAAKNALLRAGERLLTGWRVLAVPILLLGAFRIVLFPIFPETHGLVDDWYNHASYGLVFAIGLLVAHSPALRDAFRAHRRTGLALGLIGYAGVAAYTLAAPEIETLLPFARFARVVQAWGAIVALVGYALSWKVGDSPARRYLSEAIFPYYIVHQTIIVVVAYWLRPLALSNGALFPILMAATIGGCALTYEVARRAGPLRPLLGLQARPLKSRSKSHPAVAH